MISVLKNLPFDFLSHIHRSLVLRATSVSSLLLTIPSGYDHTTSILSKIDALDQELLAWNSSLPHGVWGEKTTSTKCSQPVCSRRIGSFLRI